MTWGTGPKVQAMPLTLEEFLAAEPTLAALRREIAGADRHARRPLDDEERGLVALLVNRWEAGLAGWMAAAEAEVVAAELLADAQARGLAVTAAVEVRQAGEVNRTCLVFAGGPHGQHVLEVGVTSPVRARKHWAGYTDAAAPARVSEQDAPAEPKQLGLLDTLVDLLRPSRRARGERPRLLSVPLPKSRTK